MSPLPLSRAAQSIRSSAVRDLLRDAHLPDMVSLAGGLPDAALFDVEGIEAAWERLRHRGLRESLQYGQTAGEPRLREALAAWSSAHGTPATADEVLVTTGSQQGLDLVARTLLDPGDTVVTESPTYLAALQVFQLAGARLWTVPNDADGAVVDRLLALPAERRPKLVYLVTNFANPSGASLSLERRQALLRWAAEHRVFVLEDDPYGLLRFDGAPLPSLRALCRDIPDAAPWVGYASSLSKVVAPGLRLGWLLLPTALRSACLRVKQALDLHTATVPQALAAELLASGRPLDRLPPLQRAYAARRAGLCDALAAHFGADITFTRPQGGMFVWARLTAEGEGVDTAALLPAARAAGVLYVPGEAFTADADGTCRHHLRLSFVSAPPERLARGVERLAQVTRSRKP